MTGMGGNGIEFGIQTAATGNRWYTTPAPLISGIFLKPTTTEKDLLGYLGDSCVTEVWGLGGMSAIAGPAYLRMTGGIWSNAPLSLEWKLPEGAPSREHTAIDYGEEEFTLGRPHPAIDASIRRPAILKEAADPTTAVIVLDFILTPPGHMDPCGYVVPDILKAQEIAAARGGKIAFIASVLGTTADWQDIRKQERELEEAGVIVCRTNYRAAILAAEIIKLRRKDA